MESRHSEICQRQGLSTLRSMHSPRGKDALKLQSSLIGLNSTQMMLDDYLRG